MLYTEKESLRRELEKSIKGSKIIKIAVAYWNSIALKLLDNSDSSKEIEIICDAKSEATDLSVIRRLFNRRVYIRLVDNLLAKVFIFEKDCWLDKRNNDIDCVCKFSFILTL